MADELDAWLEKVNKLTDPSTMQRMLNAAGKAGKTSALDAASKTLGGDRKFSNWKGKPALSAGYDLDGSSKVAINFRPAGLWRLAEAGRHASGSIFPRAGRGKGKTSVFRRAVKTPDGPRSRSSYGRSRGVKSYTEASRDAAKSVPQAAHEQFLDEIRRVI